MNKVSCYICGSKSFHFRVGKVRDNESLTINECNDCGLVFLSSSDHIKETHYQESGMHGEVLPDIQEWLNETDKDDERRYQFLKEKMVNKTILDFGCGVGGFLLKSKTIASNVEGVELESRLQSHYQANSILVYKELDELVNLKKKFDLITAFHVIEHLIDPIHTIQYLTELLAENGELIVEVPSSNDALLTLYQSKAFSEFTYWSQHLYLFNSDTFQNMIKKTKLTLNWIKHIQRYPLSNHLYWLANGKPGGHKIWNHLNSKELDSVYESTLASIGMTDTLIASIGKK